jgi:hypothetical protein
MGNGSGVGGLNSRIYTNSYAYQSQRTSYPKPIGYSFAGFSKPMYSYQTYHTLANNGPAIASRALRVDRAQGRPPIGFIPPTSYRQI